mgnify:CR=1 FL=1
MSLGDLAVETMLSPYVERFVLTGQSARLSAAALETLSQRCAAVTTEFENVPAASLEYLAARVPVRPGAQAVSIAQDRVREKTFLREEPERD